jgi:hypothetical protein
MSSKSKKNVVVEESVNNTAVETVVETVVEQKVEKRGRPIDPTSPRQIRIQAKLLAEAQGLKITRGRKVNPECPRQKRLAGYAEKVAAGIEVKRGRPKMKKEETPAEAV